MKHLSLLFSILYPIIATADEATEGIYCFGVGNCSYCRYPNYCDARFAAVQCCAFRSADQSLDVSGDETNDQAAELVFVDEATERLVCIIQACSDCAGTCLTKGKFPLCCYPNADDDIPSGDGLVGEETIAAHHDRDSIALRGYKN